MTNTIVNFESLPFWQGCVAKSGKYASLGLSVVADASGLMYQPLSKELERHVISNYSQDDYGFITKPPGHSQWANYLGDQLFQFSEAIIAGRSNLRILEIGGGSTYVAKKICDQFSVQEYVIVDPALNSSAVENYEKIKILSEYYDGQDYGKFDVVLMFHCLEHIPNPEAILESISKIKNKNLQSPEIGLAFPNVQDQLLRYDLNVFLHEHINYFTPKSVHNLLCKVGFKILNYRSDGDEFRLILKASKYPECNEGVVIDSRGDIVDVASKFQEKLEDLHRRLELQIDSGRAIGFHGANNGLNNLFHLAPWLGEDASFIIYDGDEAKKNMYLPSMPTQPIVFASEKMGMTPEILIVSAMTYYDQISRFWKQKFNFIDAQIHPLYTA